ncbi:unnamed protein product [Durusdinium trenchii]|uniref:Uncharacterized protein n=3 Tax=Durusdinium trenchii TaxID=1381693 RepID=A0ABP0KNV6_9DINO
MFHPTMAALRPAGHGSRAVHPARRRVSPWVGHCHPSYVADAALIVSFLRLRASKRPSASAVRQKLAKGVLQRAVDVPDPVAEFQALREDPFASWSLLGDQEFLQRILMVLLVAFLPCFYLSMKVYPLSNELGEWLPQNLLAASAFGLSFAALILTAVLLRIGSRQVEVNQLLRQGSILLETRGGGYFVKKKTAMKMRKDARRLSELLSPTK